ncbi:MAG: hypothetical protein R2911_41035 [Caldilineaceae bacterium]
MSTVPALAAWLVLHIDRHNRRTPSSAFRQRLRTWRWLATVQ